MVSADYYKQQARVLMEWARTSDDSTAQKLRQRAQEYLTLAQALEPSFDPSPPPAAMQDQPNVQQQEQIQPRSDTDDKTDE